MTDPIVHRFPAQLAHLRAVRRMVRESLESLAINESSIDQAVLVLDEIVSNAESTVDMMAATAAARKSTNSQRRVGTCPGLRPGEL